NSPLRSKLGEYNLLLENTLNFIHCLLPLPLSRIAYRWPARVRFLGARAAKRTLVKRIHF
ncbi:MAG: hypothetical protein ACRCTP_01765, partial [Aeromonas popoffii]|uniref:hypothetical protein n=1 Tax=Aeromonas popoffii TaxID=70856 RepID=UPI003F401EEE